MPFFSCSVGYWCTLILIPVGVREPRRILLLSQSAVLLPNYLCCGYISLHSGATRCDLTYPHFQTAIQWENRNRTAPTHIQVINIKRNFIFNIYSNFRDESHLYLRLFPYFMVRNWNWFNSRVVGVPSEEKFPKGCIIPLDQFPNYTPQKMADIIPSVSELGSDLFTVIIEEL